MAVIATRLDHLIVLETFVGERHYDPIDEALVAPLEENLKVFHKLPKQLHCQFILHLRCKHVIEVILLDDGVITAM